MAKDTEKIKARETQELAKWQGMANKKTYQGYMLVAVLLISLIRILDEFVTSAPGSMQTDIVNDFFVKTLGMDFAAGLSQLSLITTALMIFTILATLYMSLADKFGRKRILVISIFGMALGSLLCFWSPNLTVFIMGRALLSFFVATDIHIIFVTELAPANKRATFNSVASFFGYLSMLLVSVSRGASTSDGVLYWRNVFLIPALIGFALAGLMLVFGRETKPFLDRRIELLSTPYDVRKEKAEEKKEKMVKAGGVGQAFKYLFRNKQPSNVIIVTIFQTAAVMAFFGFYETIMTTSGMSTEEVTKALFAYPIVCALVSLMTGILADKIGRKLTCSISSMTAFLALLAFIFAARSNINPYLVGALFGLELGFFWSYGNILGIITIEVVPTEIRSAVGAARGLMAAAVALVSAVVISILVKTINLGTLCLVWGAIFLGISIILLIFTVKETKDVDLRNVKAS